VLRRSDTSSYATEFVLALLAVELMTVMLLL
jgi:hypothetical protein